MIEVIESLREATSGTDYEGRLYLVGGIVRDRILGLPTEEDIDIVLEGDASQLADFLFDAGITDHKPVVFPRFGTAMVTISGHQVELVSARSESYASDSRKPEVAPATLQEDVFRRDFTINTLLENLHTAERLDLTGQGLCDLEKGIIRTPTNPLVTFEDDPLRMLRAVRFAARFGFHIDEETYSAIEQRSFRLGIISKERIRDEFTKMLMAKNSAIAIEMLRTTGLLGQFASELVEMHGVTQNVYHIYDIWTHTIKTIESLPDDADLCLRLAAVFHDIGKPATRTVDEKGQVHFYTHQAIGAEKTKKILTRLRFPNEIVARVTKIIFMHLRVGEFDEEWSDGAIRRLLRDAGSDLDALIELTRADRSAANPEYPSADLNELQKRIKEVMEKLDIEAIRSPLNGFEIMELLSIPEGPLLREVKDFLVNEIIEDRLALEDKEHAKQLVIQQWGENQ